MTLEILKIRREITTRKVVIIISDISANVYHKIYISLQKEIMDAIGPINNCLLDKMRGWRSLEKLIEIGI